MGESDPYGVITVIRNKLFCLSCNQECSHVAYVRSYLDLDEPPEILQRMISMLSAQSKSTESTFPLGVSWKKTSFDLPANIKRILRDGILQSFHCTTDGDVILSCESSLKSCSSCNSQLYVEVVKLPLVTDCCIFSSEGRTAYLFTRILYTNVVS